MLLERIKKQIKRTNELFNEYTYMNKNLQQLEDIRMNILNLVKNWEQYQDDIVRLWAITDLDHELIKISLLDYVYKINIKINILRNKPIKYSNKEKDQHYKIIKNHILTNNFQKLEKFLNENIIDLEYIPSDKILININLLLLSCKNNNLNIVKILVNNKANIEVLDKNKINPLLTALNNHNYEIAEYLLQCGANPNICDVQNNNALMKSIGNINFFENLITKYGADVNLSISYGTILHYACKFLDKKVIIFLLSKDANVRAVNDDDDTALHILINERNTADINENLEIIDILIENEIDINWQNNDGNTPLHCATEIENINYVNILLDNGARTDLKNAEGELPKDIALKYGELEIFSLLRENSDVCQEKYKNYDDFNEETEYDDDFL